VTSNVVSNVSPFLVLAGPSMRVFERILLW